MTTELVLLLGIYAYIVMGIFLGNYGPLATFKNSAPRLGARIERNIAIGREFNDKSGKGVVWKMPGGQ